MSPPDLPVDASGAQGLPGLAEAGAYATAESGFEHGLVVLAMGESYCLAPGGEGYRLLVEPAALTAVREQLACFDRESAGWPPPPESEAAPPAGGADWSSPMAWAAVVVAVFLAQQWWPGRLEAAGALDAQALFARGEWWRPVTALFLHADLGHVTSNLVSGFFVFAAVAGTLGRGRGWLLVALASVAGNTAAAAMHYSEPYRSLGASTAIFAGLGLLTGRAIRALRQPGRAHRWRSVSVPLGAGLALLALFGGGGGRTDVGAHVAGFGAGLALGLIAGGGARSAFGAADGSR